MQTISQKGVWCLVNLPVGSKFIATSWVYQVKKESNDYIERHETRLVGKGFSQKPGTDFRQIDTPVIDYTTLRFVLELVVHLQIKMIQVYVKSAFLIGEIQEYLYIV